MNKIFISTLLFGVLFTGCFSGSKNTNDKILFVTILPLKYFTDKIVGETYKVEVTVPPGVGPETYSPTPKQMVLLSKAQAYFSIGYLGFEQAFLEKFKSTNPNVQVFSTAKGIDLIKGLEEHGDHNHTEGVDPHIWSSPKEARTIAQNIFDGMVQIDPENKALFQQNLNKLLSEIDRVDSTVNLILKKVAAKKFIIFHPALGYFARDYGLEQLSIEFEGKVPSPKHLQTVIEEAKLGNIGFILIQKEFDKENAEIISKETGSKIIQIDPLAYDWPAQMIDIAEKLSLPNQSTN